MNKRNRIRNKKSQSRENITNEEDIIIEDNKEEDNKEEDNNKEDNKKQKINITENEEIITEQENLQITNNNRNQELLNNSPDANIIEQINRQVNNIIIGNGTSETGQIIDRSLALNRLLGLINNNINTHPNILNYVNESNDTLISTFNNIYINNINTINNNNNTINNNNNNTINNNNNIINNNNNLNNQYIPMINPENNIMEQLSNILGRENIENVNNNNNNESESEFESDDEDEDEDNYDNEDGDNYDNEYRNNDNNEQSPEEYANNILTDGFDYQINDVDYERLSEILNDIFIDSMQYDDDSDEIRINNTIKRFISMPRNSPKILVKVILLYTESGKNILFENNYMTVIDSIKDGLKRNLENERRVRQFANLFFRGVGINFDNLEDVKVVLKESEFEKMKEIKYKDAKMLKNENEEKILCEDSTCVICQEETEDNDYIRIMPKCKHFYHKDCIDKWLREESNKCPLCKCEVGEGERID